MKARIILASTGSGRINGHQQQQIRDINTLARSTFSKFSRTADIARSGGHRRAQIVHLESCDSAIALDSADHT